MNDMHALLPHSKKDAKLDSKCHLEDLNELAELNNCNNCLYFEMRKHQDMYMWMSKTPNGPSVKFLVRNGNMNSYRLFLQFQYSVSSAYNG
jgi:ribosome biogenesis protein BRX1